MAFSETLTKAKNLVLGIRTEAEAESGISRDQKWRSALHTWRKRTFKLAATITGVGLLIRSGPFLLFGALPAWTLYGAVRLADYALERDIRSKAEAVEKLEAEKTQASTPRPSPQPAPKPEKKASGGFNATAEAPAAENAVQAPAQQSKTFWVRLGLR